MLLLQVSIRNTCPQKRWSKEVCGIRVTTVTIMRTKKGMLCHLRDLIVPFGISIVVQAERGVQRDQVKVSLLSQLRRKGAGRQLPLHCPFIWLFLSKCFSSQ